MPMHPGYKVVETDNFGGDYPNEKFATPYTFWTKEDAKKVADVLNSILNPDGNQSRYCIVVELPYKLQPGFEP